MTLRVVGLVSSYKEGALVRSAIRSLGLISLDRIYVYEGPAGPVLGNDIPESDLLYIAREDEIVIHRGRWRSDARKRNDMLQRAKADFPESPLWGVVVDGDEVLVNGEYLRDRLQALLWDDEAKGAEAGNKDRPQPWMSWPLQLVESEGSMSIVTARVLRLDLIRSIDVSTSVMTNVHGVQVGLGNHPLPAGVWQEAFLRAIDEGKMIAWPPLPCEPYLVHRSNLRHPARRGLRMSEQEAAELKKAEAEARSAEARARIVLP